MIKKKLQKGNQSTLKIKNLHLQVQSNVYLLLFTKLQRALIQRAPFQRDQTELLADRNCVNHRNKLAIT